MALKYYANRKLQIVVLLSEQSLQGHGTKTEMEGQEWAEIKYTGSCSSCQDMYREQKSAHIVVI